MENVIRDSMYTKKKEKDDREREREPPALWISVRVGRPDSDFQSFVVVPDTIDDSFEKRS